MNDVLRMEKRATETFEGTRLLVVDGDNQVYRLLEDLSSTWGIRTERVIDPSQVLDQVRQRFYHLILLDVVMSGRRGIHLIPEIAALCPYSKIITITAYEDKETAIKALSLGAFDFLEKPIEHQLLSHSLKRTLDVQKIELQFRKTYDDLKRSHNDLLVHKSRSEQLNQKLMDTNKALSVLAENIALARRETGKEFALRIRSFMIPILEKLEQDRALAHYHGELKTLVSQLEDLTSCLATDMKITTLLSSSELRIASLIKNGLTTDAIAGHLFIAPSTVKTHRRNIRRKLGINNQQCNLRDHLRSEPGGDSDGRGQI